MLKNKVYFIALIVVLCSLVVGLLKVRKVEIKNTDSKGKSIICFGDSITFGYGAEQGEDYPTALAKLLKATVLNAGIDGDTTVEALKRLQSDVLGRNPRLVIIEFGGNDFLRGIPMETTINNVREMIERIQANDAMVAIADISAGIFMKDYRRALSIIAKEKGVIFIPAILNDIITNPTMKSDFLHPNANGYKIIAASIFTAIKPYLKI